MPSDKYIEMIKLMAHRQNLQEKITSFMAFLRELDIDINKYHQYNYNLNRLYHTIGVANKKDILIFKAELKRIENELIELKLES